MGEAAAIRSQIIDALVAAIVAPGCAACHRPLEHPTRSAVCEPCWNSIHPMTPPFCDGCGEPLPSWRNLSVSEGRCARCRRRSSAISRARAAGTYDGTLRALLHALKYERRRSLARPLGEFMRRHGGDVLDGVGLVVPVPLHRGRRRSRGFNQAEDLAAQLHLPVALALRRCRATPSQADLPAARRHTNVRDAFALGRGADVRGMRILLVDDVSTTGATLEACARVLRDAGAVDVRALTVARAVARSKQS
jgi:ComF family protein